MDSKKANMITKFSYKQRITIAKGFYKNKQGYVKDVEQDKEGENIYTIMLTKGIMKNGTLTSVDDQEIKIGEGMLKAIISFFPWMR